MSSSDPALTDTPDEDRTNARRTRRRAAKKASGTDWWARAQGDLLADPRRPRLPQLHRQALLHPVRIDDAGAAQGRPAGRQQISLWLVLGVARASTSCRRCQGRLFGRMPERGDIVILTPPGETSDYIKRVIGLPGDTLEMIDGTLYINGRAVKRERAAAGDGSRSTPTSPATSTAIRRSPAARGGRQALLPSCPSSARPCPTAAATTRSTSACPTSTISPRSSSPPAMSGCRATIATSRPTAGSRLRGQGLGGAVPWENIGGRAEFITFSLDGSSPYLNPISWITAMRGGRAGTSLRPQEGKAP